MGAQKQRLLDVAGARRAGDEIQRPRHLALAVARAQHGEDGFHLAADAVGLHHDDVVFRQEVEARRVLRTGDEDQRAGLGDGGLGMGEAVEIVAVADALADGEGRGVEIGVGEARVFGHSEIGGEIVLAQPAGDLAGQVAIAGDPRGGGVGPLGHADEQRHLLVLGQLAALGHDADGRAGHALLDDAPALGVVGAGAVGAADPAEDGFAGGCAHRLSPVVAWDFWAYCCMKVRPSGAGRSRHLVQPPASGSEAKRRLRPAASFRSGIAIDTAAR